MHRGQFTAKEKLVSAPPGSFHQWLKPRQGAGRSTLVGAVAREHGDVPAPSEAGAEHAQC